MNKATWKKLLVGDFSLKRVLKSTLLIYVCVLLYGVLFSDRQIFQPQSLTYQDTAEIIKLTTRDGAKISAVYLPNPKATYTILHSHGNAEDIGDVRLSLEDLQKWGFAAFSYDYHGYGTSHGKPSEKNAYQDIDAAYDYLTQQLKVPPDRIIAHGRSVGGGPTMDLVARKPVAGVILESTFVSAFRVLTHYPIFPVDKFRNLSKIRKVHCPVLIIHGRQDHTIPFWHGEKLFASANEPKRCYWAEKATHDNVSFIDAESYAKAFCDFAELVRETQRKDGKGSGVASK